MTSWYKSMCGEEKGSEIDIKNYNKNKEFNKNKNKKTIETKWYKTKCLNDFKTVKDRKWLYIVQSVRT